jgi:hypothetical protein
MLVYRIRIRTEGTGRRKTPHITIDLAFDESRPAPRDPASDSGSLHYAKA